MQKGDVHNIGMTPRQDLSSKYGLARSMQILQVTFLQDLQDLALNLARILQVLH